MSPAFPFEVVLTAPIPAELVSDVQGKWHYVSESLVGIQLEADRRTVRFGLKAGAEDQADRVREKLAQIAGVMVKGYRGGAAKVVLDRSWKEFPFRTDPHPELESRGLVIRLGPGRYALSGDARALLELFDQDLVEAAGYLQPESFQFPSILSAELLHRCRYIKSFPHALSLVMHLREDIEAIQRFAQSVGWKDDHLECDASSLSAPSVLLAPTVCFHCYGAFADTRIRETRTVTARGKCFRYESGNMRGLERLWDFSMREVIFFGGKEHVQQQRMVALERFGAVLDRWGFSYQVQTASDPFFIDDFSSQSSFQKAFDLKYEVRADLPYREGASVAIGSFNLHHDFFGKSFGISNERGEPVFTGCLGFGLERVVLAFLSQFGIDRGGWPAVVADRI
jgi:seryl-tRNA synthetase